MSEPEWFALIEAASAISWPKVRAHTYVQKFNPSFASPVALRCDDGKTYVVKTPTAGHAGRSRGVFNDHVIAILAQLLEAPVPPATLVELPEELVAAQPEMSHLEPGIGHGSRFVEGCTDKLGVDHTTISENRLRFATLAVLYGWVGGADQQMIYRKEPPPLVYSVDHGHMFAGAPAWTVGSLNGAAPAALDASVMNRAKPSEAELTPALESLGRVGEHQIGEAVGRPPASWGVSMEERIALAKYLDARRKCLVATGRKA